jgi:hypothetical protein
MLMLRTASWTGKLQAFWEGAVVGTQPRDGFLLDDGGLTERVSENAGEARRGEARRRAVGVSSVGTDGAALRLRLRLVGDARRCDPRNWPSRFAHGKSGYLGPPAGIAWRH